MAARGDDWSELVELLHRFTWATDTGARSLIDDVLCPSVTFDTESVTGRPAAAFEKGSFSATLAASAAAFDGMQHLIGNHLVTVSEDGRTAVVEAYGHVSLAVDGEATAVKRNGVRYRLDAIRADGPPTRWLIKAIRVSRVWDEPNPVVAEVIAARRQRSRPAQGPS